MVDYITITHARTNLKGSIIAKVIGLGEVNSGTGKKGKWEKQIATLKDNSETQQLILWNDDIGKLEQGQILMFENPFWTEYKGEPQLSLGKFCIMHLANEDDLLAVHDAFEDDSDISLTPRKEVFGIEKLDKIDIQLDKLIEIELIITKKLPSGATPAKIGMYMKFVYDYLEKQN